MNIVNNYNDLSKVFEKFLKFYGWEFDEKLYLIDLRGYDLEVNPERNESIFVKKK